MENLADIPELQVQTFSIRVVQRRRIWQRMAAEGIFVLSKASLIFIEQSFANLDGRKSSMNILMKK